MLLSDSDFVVADSSPISVAQAGLAIVSSDDPTVAIPGGVSPGSSVSEQFVLGVQTTGSFSFFVVVEALP